MWARIHLTPLLQAEEDRDQVRRYWADQAREKELLGQNVKVYNTDRYVTSACPLIPPPLSLVPPLKAAPPHLHSEF
jgi:phosphatidylserine/phosphatidylglycerophosphate/cardiolipin synthase-like enzyme